MSSLPLTSMCLIIFNISNSSGKNCFLLYFCCSNQPNSHLFVLIQSSSWCLQCKAIPKVTCEGQHRILNHKEDEHEVEGLKLKVSSTFTKAVEKRQQIEEFLQTAINDNAKCLEELRSLAGMEQLLTGKTGTSAARKELEEAMNKANEEIEVANSLWNELTGHKTNVEYRVFPYIL